MAALMSVSGLPSHEFTFVGFIQNYKRQDIAEWKGTYVFYESTKRILKTLRMIKEVQPEARICVGREITKFHEEIRQFSMDEAIEWAHSHKTLKGELAAVLHCPGVQASNAEETLREEAKFLFEKGLSHKDLMTLFSSRGLEKKKLYNLLLELQKSL